MSNLPNPDILIEGMPYRSPTFNVKTADDGLPVIDDDRKSVADLLRQYQIESINNKGFWSLQLLRHILSRDRVLSELKEYTNLNPETYVDYIRPEEDSPETSGTQIYLKIFALLLLLGKGKEIENFVRDEASDQSLPLLRHPPRWNVDLRPQNSPRQALPCLQKWATHEKESFERMQWELLVPYFDLDERNMARHYSLHEESILPWCKRDKGQLSATKPSGNQGGFAFVTCVKIDPLSHGFRKVLKAISLNDGLFALKTLLEKDDNNENNFQNEAKQLQRFNGLVHDHLVTLLSTFSLAGRYHFLFPYADYALDRYWVDRVSKPDLNLHTIQWVAKQCSGIMAAMDTIHNPQHLHLNPLEVKGYGRHGDIKPDNILWFNSTTDPRGILVVSDLGLAAFHRDTSRSNIPNEGIPKVPGYRPPECDIKGGTISRAYDIWTLGCLFLELLTWLLGGKEYLNEFDEKRRTMFLLTGAKNNIFFSLQPTGEPSAHVAQVKPEVTAWFDKLHGDNNCSQFIHETLDVIEKEMLVVLSQEKQRSLSGKLREKFQGIYSKCLDTNDSDYCTEGIPIRRIFRPVTAVDAMLNENAEKAMKQNPPGLGVETYKGKTNKSLTPKALENIDG